MGRVMRFVVALLSVAALAGGAVSGANSQVLGCGAEVTTNVTLTAPMTGCSTGLVVGADGITVDLNGYAIEGVGADAGSGIEAVGRSGITIKNGDIRGFDAGVRLVGVNGSTVERLTISDTNRGISLGNFQILGADSSFNEIRGNTVTNSSSGIFMEVSHSNQVLKNSLLDNSGSGVFCFAGQGNQIESNISVGNGTGIELISCTETSLLKNVASRNRTSGIWRQESPGIVQKNAANDNGGLGIFSFDSHAAFTQNVTNGNGLNGLHIEDSQPGHGPFHSITGHLANANGGYAIFTSVEGVIDGGKNRARANGEPTQCFGFLCN